MSFFLHVKTIVEILYTYSTNTDSNVNSSQYCTLYSTVLDWNTLQSVNYCHGQRDYITYWTYTVRRRVLVRKGRSYVLYVIVRDPSMIDNASYATEIYIRVVGCSSPHDYTLEYAADD